MTQFRARPRQTRARITLDHAANLPSPAKEHAADILPSGKSAPGHRLATEVNQRIKSGNILKARRAIAPPSSHPAPLPAESHPRRTKARHSIPRERPEGLRQDGRRSAILRAPPRAMLHHAGGFPQTANQPPARDSKRDESANQKMKRFHNPPRNHPCPRSLALHGSRIIPCGRRHAIGLWDHGLRTRKATDRQASRGVI